VNFAVDTEQPLAMSGPAEAVQAGKKPILPIGGPGQARLDPREFAQAGPGFTEAWPAWPVGNTVHMSLVADSRWPSQEIPKNIDFPPPSSHVLPAD